MKAVSAKVYPRGLYLRMATLYQYGRRLWLYPDTAKPGMVNYDLYWREKFGKNAGTMSVWRQERARIFSRIVNTGDRVLDIGLGDGAVLKYLIDHAGVEGCGLDISEQAVQFCRSQGLDVRQSDANQPIDDFVEGVFDYVIMSEIIEHMPDPENLLCSLRPYVRKGLIISIPNTGYHHHRLRLLFGRFPLQWVVTPGEHLRFWTLTDFRWWARALGFEIVHEIPYQGTPFLNRVFPGLFAAGVVYVLRFSDPGQRC